MTRTRKGYSLIELVIAIGLLAMILVGGVRLFATSLRGAQKATNIARVRENGDTALVAIERAIRPGQSATGGGSSCTIHLPGGGDNLLEQFDGNQRIRLVEDGTLEINLTTPEVSVDNTLSCTLEPDGTVRVSFTLEAGQGQAAYEKQFQTVVKMRNIE